MIPGTTFDINIAEEVWRKEEREEGRKEERRELAKKLKALAIMSVEQIAEITGFSISEIESL